MLMISDLRLEICVRIHPPNLPVLQDEVSIRWRQIGQSLRRRRVRSTEFLEVWRPLADNPQSRTSTPALLDEQHLPHGCEYMVRNHFTILIR
jgi:hypothetical protein